MESEGSNKKAIEAKRKLEEAKKDNEVEEANDSL